jgi:hypothetical protein
MKLWKNSGKNFGEASKKTLEKVKCPFLRIEHCGVKVPLKNLIHWISTHSGNITYASPI